MYEGEEGKNLGLKNFTIDHLSSFEPALFLDLANEWPALKEWDDSKLKEAFGAENDYETIPGRSYIYAKTVPRPPRNDPKLIPK